MGAMTKKRMLWFGGVVIVALVTGLITLVVGWMQAREPVLVFDAGGSQQLQEKDATRAIYWARVDNIGNKEADEVVCTVRIADAHLDKPKFDKPLSMESTDEIRDDTLMVRIKTLNPGDSIQLSFLASGKGELPEQPGVSLRGRGVTGMTRQVATPKPNGVGHYLWVWLPVLVTVVAMPTIFGISSLMDWLINRIKMRTSVVQIEVKLVDDEHLKVRVLKGPLLPKDWVHLTDNELHSLTGKYGSDFRRYGNGKHSVQTR